MPLFTVCCPSCAYTLDDMLCTYVEAQSKECPKCKHIMKIVPQTGCVIWACDTTFSASKKSTKEGG